MFRMIKHYKSYLTRYTIQFTILNDNWFDIESIPASSYCQLICVAIKQHTVNVVTS